MWSPQRVMKGRASGMVDSASQFEPPREPLQATLIGWGKEKVLFRVHEERFAANAFNESDSGNARFSPIFDSSKLLIPTLYAGSTLDCALMETVFHDVPYKAGLKTVSRSRLVDRVYSIVRLSQNIRLIDLGTISLRKLGIPRNALIDTTKAHYPRTRRWAEALHEQFEEAHGLHWTSRQDDQSQAVVLFGDRMASSDLTISSAPSALREEAQPILPVFTLANRLGVLLID
jgi:hypothetical protein